jgi:hypothetical protein
MIPLYYFESDCFSVIKISEILLFVKKISGFVTPSSGSRGAIGGVVPVSLRGWLANIDAINPSCLQVKTVAARRFEGVLDARITPVATAAIGLREYENADDRLSGRRLRRSC